MGPRSTLWLLAVPVLCVSAQTVQFNRDVRPILSDKCFLCHGPDARTKNIPLRLDQEAAAKADLGGGRHAIVAGKPEASELIRRITAESAGRRMPPAHTGRSLSEAEIETLRRWIAEGARWERHWAFLKPQRPPEPQVRNAGWVRNAIDRFVLARLEQGQMAGSVRPAKEVSRERLIRRVSLDLTGLPPTPAEIDAFLADRSESAFEKVVDRLLASPRYGERMAAIWLDAARYADSNGYQFDGERVMWRWRDWVIEAFNRNLPYDQFVREQIAGDLLPNPTLDQVIATGFNRNHRANTEDGIIPEEYAVEYVVDRLETASTVFLGLTVGCARCHNHKYDPISQKEFYQLYAYFNNVPENGRAMKYGNSPPLIPAPTREQQAALEAVDRRIREVEHFLATRESEIDDAVRTWGQDQGVPEAWVPASGLAYQLAAATFDGSSPVTANGKAAFDIDDAFTLSAWIIPDAVDNAAVITRMSNSAKGKGFGLYLIEGRLHFHITSNYADDAIRVETEPRLRPNERHHVLVTYDGSVSAAGVKFRVDGEPVPAKVLSETLYRPFRNAGRAFVEPLRIGGGGGKERLYRGRIESAAIYSRVVDGDELRALARRREAEADREAWYYLENEAPETLRAPWNRLQALRREREQLARTFPTVMVMAESPVRKPTHLLIRGAYDKPGEPVEPGVPEVLHPLPTGAPNNRLGLAQWLVSPANPLTARVAVNRLWQIVFGTGLVKTSEDFGQQGEWPSHPELLDWLATEYVRTGWNTKAMLKLLVTSATYRQSSAASPELLQRDPENRLLARGPRFRLSAEMVRDQALFVSGLLHEKRGGPSVKPYQPDGLWAEITMQDSEYVQSKGPDLYRRSLYTYWKRTVAPPMLSTFDAANREACVVRTSRTNTPLQALTVMNDVTFVEASRKLAERMMKAPDEDARLSLGFRLATSRLPKPEELEILRSSLRFHRDYFDGEASRAAAYLAQGDSEHDPALDAKELASYAAVASLILNLDEVITKE